MRNIMCKTLFDTRVKMDRNAKSVTYIFFYGYITVKKNC